MKVVLSSPARCGIERAPNGNGGLRLVALGAAACVPGARRLHSVHSQMGFRGENYP